MFDDRTFAYVGNTDSNDIAVVALGRDGTASVVHRVALDGSVASLAAHPDGRTLYAALREDPAIVSLAVDSRSGALKPLSVVPAPANFAYVKTDWSGRWLFGASYGDDLIAVLPLSPLGLVQTNPTELARPGRNPHCIIADNSNRFVYVPCLGSDYTAAYRFDACTGRLVAAEPPVAVSGREAGPRHIAVSPDNRVVYVLMEMSGDVVPHVLDDRTGGLAARAGVSMLHPDNPLPASTYTPPRNQTAGGNSPSPVVWAADIRLTPDGRFLYASERTRSTLTCFAVDPVSGRLDFAGIFDVEAQPRHFGMDPKGEYVLVAGEKSHHVGVYAIDRATGGLRLTSRVEVGRRPDWVEMINFR